MNPEELIEKTGIDKIPPYWDRRYVKNLDKLSKPVYKIKEERDVYVPMRDGVKICVDIFRPDVEGEKFPALLCWASYGKSIQSLRNTPVPVQSLVFDHTQEAGDIDFFVKRGYVIVVADPRGIGKSEGEWYGIYCEQEQKDMYDLIEWIAKQPWCNGNVGMLGLSYFGKSQMLAAGEQPPHLKAIMPITVSTDYYLHCYRGGILNTYYYGFLHLCPANNPVPESLKLYGEDELKRKMQERLEDPDIRAMPLFVKILTTWPPRFHTLFLDILLHPLDGPFWHKRGAKYKYDKIKIPVYMLNGWSPEGGRFHGFDAYTDPRLNVPKKLFVYGTFFRVIQLPGIRFLNEEILRWYDYWLKGIDTGIMDEPPIRIFVRGVDKYRWEYEWPLARTKWTKFYLKRFGKLETTPELDEDLPPDSFTHVPPTISTEVQSLKYSTDPLTKPLEVTGPIALYLYAAIDQEDANFIAKLYDVFPNGKRIPLQTGYLKASHRTLIKEESKPWKPVHDHTKEVPVKPGEINEYVIEIQPISNVFLPGHCIALEIKSMDPSPYHMYEWNKATMVGPLPSAKETHYQIYRDAKHKSHLLLPIILSSDPESWVQPLNSTE